MPTEAAPAEAPWRTTWSGFPPNYGHVSGSHNRNDGTSFFFFCPYLTDILPHPLQRLPLIQKPSIQIPIRPNLLASQKPQRPDTVVEIDEHDIPARLLDHRGPVEVGIRIGHEPATLDIDPDGKTGVGRRMRRLEDVDEETVLPFRRGRFFGARVNADGF